MMFLSILPGHYLQLDAEPGADLQHAAQLDSGSTMFEFHQRVSGDTAQRRGIVQRQARLCAASSHRFAQQGWGDPEVEAGRSERFD